MIEVVPAKLTHVGPIANNMAEIDRMECAVFNHSPRQALRLGLANSYLSLTVLIDDKPEAMFGVVTQSLIEGRGTPWLLLTNKGRAQGKALVRLGHKYTEGLHKQYPLLHNWVSADNHAAIRWLTRLGYMVGAVDVIKGQPMRPFQRSAVGV